jgi:hypothetical protein
MLVGYEVKVLPLSTSGVCAWVVRMEGERRLETAIITLEERVSLPKWGMCRAVQSRLSSSSI